MMKKRQDIDKFGYNYHISTFQLILKDCARSARADALAAAKMKFRRASLRLKALGTEDALNALAAHAAAGSENPAKPRAQTVRQPPRKRTNPRKLFEQNGIYFIDKGRCTIVYRNRGKRGTDPFQVGNSDKNAIVSEISRGDSFGGSNIFNCPGLDYLGDIVAGD